MNDIGLAVSSPPHAAVAPGIVAIGGLLPGDTPLTWAPPLPFPRPVQCYLVQSGDDALLIDTGLTVHRTAILESLSSLIGGRPPPRIVMTRWEPDAMINLPPIIDRMKIPAVIWSGSLNPLDFFEHIERASAEAHLQATSGGVFLDRQAAGNVIEVGPYRFEIIRSPLSVLPTFWLHESHSHSLFTSDSFTFVNAAGAGDPLVCDDVRRVLTVDAVRDSLRCKFDWLAGIDTTPLASFVRTLFESRRVDRICPGFGRIAEGRDSVDHTVRTMLAALERLSTEPRPDPVAGFDLRRVAVPGLLPA